MDIFLYPMQSRRYKQNNILDGIFYSTIAVHFDIFVEMSLWQYGTSICLSALILPPLAATVREGCAITVNEPGVSPASQPGGSSSTGLSRDFQWYRFVPLSRYQTVALLILNQ